MVGLEILTVFGLSPLNVEGLQFAVVCAKRMLLHKPLNIRIGLPTGTSKWKNKLNRADSTPTF